MSNIWQKRLWQRIHRNKQINSRNWGNVEYVFCGQWTGMIHKTFIGHTEFHFLSKQKTAVGISTSRVLVLPGCRLVVRYESEGKVRVEKWALCAISPIQLLPTIFWSRFQIWISQLHWCQVHAYESIIIINITDTHSQRTTTSIMWVIASVCEASVKTAK